MLPFACIFFGCNQWDEILQAFAIQVIGVLVVLFFVFFNCFGNDLKGSRKILNRTGKYVKIDTGISGNCVHQIHLIAGFMFQIEEGVIEEFWECYSLLWIVD